MSARWSDATAFRADPAAVPSARPSPRQSIALLAVLVLVAGAITAASYLIRPDRARAFDLLRGSMFLADQVAPVAVDLASGKPTLRLVGADNQVGANNAAALSVVPLDGATLLLDHTTGEFNMVDETGFVIKHDGGGVPLSKRSDAMTSMGFQADLPGTAAAGFAYIERTGPKGTDVYLVGQTTVQAAVTAPKVKPRASSSTTEIADTSPGGAASANGDLWTLLGQGSTRSIREFSLPVNSTNGAGLTRNSHGSTPATSAIGTASQSADGSGADSVAIASAERIRVFDAGASERDVSLPRQDGVDSILAATNAQGRLAFLLHAADGWSVVSMAADGSGLRGPAKLRGVPADARLAPPASSQGSLYTVDQDGGAIYRIGLGGAAEPVPGAATYPLAKHAGRTLESANFADTYVIGRGPRVLVDSPSHVDALALFTDGSHQPSVIQKNTAVDVSASGGAEALTSTNVVGNQKGHNPKTRKVSGQPINNKIDCRDVTQKPHVPQITEHDPGSRSVALAWTYPILDQQDCEPSTYVVAVKVLSPNAPAPGGSVTVQGQQSTNLSGLYPSTRYQVTVTAYINGQGTPSLPVQVQTGPEGPAAPTNLQVSADSAGNWHLSWAGCGGTSQGCIPVSSWQVIPKFCDGRGLSGAPAPLTASADPTSQAQPPAVFRGSDDLLGRGLQFQVQGNGTQGQSGSPSAASACVYSWSAPQAAAMTLTGSLAPVAQFGAGTSATVRLALGSNPVRAEGGVGAEITYSLLSGGAVVATIGPTSELSVHFNGLSAGTNYVARAVVTPPRHSAPSAVVDSPTLQAATEPWPDISASLEQPHNDGATQADITVDVHGLTSADARGEHFDLTGSALVCGDANNQYGLSASDFDPGQPLHFTIDRSQFNGSCHVRIRLVEHGAGGLFGAGTSSGQADSNSQSIDPPELVGVGSGDFSAQWDGSSGGSSLVKPTYTGGNPLVSSFGGNWSASVTDPDGDACGGYSGASSLGDVTVAQSCVDKDGATGTGWQVQVSFTFFGQGKGPYTATPIDGGAASTYNPPQCTLSDGGLTATWSGSAANPVVTIEATQPDQIKDCSQWSYSVFTPQNAPCGTSDPGVGAPAQQVAVPSSCPTAPSAGWTVVVAADDPSSNRETVSVPVTGQLPS